MAVTHAKVSAIAATADPSLVSSTDWNAAHTVSLTASDVGAGPSTADYLVGTAQGGLSAEIVVGTAPGGELGGTWAIPTVDASHSGSTHAATQSAAEATAASALATHDVDTTGVHGITNTANLYAVGGTDVAVADGGTGSSTAANARTALGLAIGTDVAAQSVDAAQATGSLRTITTAAAQAVGTAAAGNGTAAASSNHVHPTGAGTPSTQAMGDSAATGSGPAAAMTDHKHAMPAFATNAILLGTAAAAGNATTPTRSNDTIAAFDATVPVTQAFADAAATGSIAFAARRDHKHGMPAAPTTIANDTIWDAAGDLAVASGADAAARLAKGAAGGALSMVNSAVAWNSGTSMPANKATGDRYWRTDLGFEVYWDGTQWLTTQLFSEPLAYQDGLAPNVSSGGASFYLPLWNGAYDVYIDRFIAATTVLTLNNGTNFWTVQFQDSASNNIGATFNTSADTAGTNTGHTVTVGVLTGTTVRYLSATVTKTLSPGGLYLIAKVVYRLKVT